MSAGVKRERDVGDEVRTQVGRVYTASKRASVESKAANSQSSILTVHGHSLQQ